MTETEIKSLLQKQRNYYLAGATLPVKFRIEKLKTLYRAVQKYEKEIGEALTKDLGKSSFEGFMCESGLLLTEISYLIKNTKKFATKAIIPILRR